MEAITKKHFKGKNLPFQLSYANHPGTLTQDDKYNNIARMIENEYVDTTKLSDYITDLCKCLDFVGFDISCDDELIEITDEVELAGIEKSLKEYTLYQFFNDYGTKDQCNEWMDLSVDFMDYERIPLNEFCDGFAEIMDIKYSRDIDSIKDILSTALNHLRIVDGYKLKALCYTRFGGWGIRPVVYKDDQTVDKVRYISLNILDYLEVPFTERGIMQAWLLKRLSDFLPMDGYEVFGSRFYLFGGLSIFSIFHNDNGVIPEQGLWRDLYYKRLPKREEVLGIDKETLYPSVVIDGDQATLSCCYWNDWTGLVKVTVLAKRIGNSVRFEHLNSEILIEHDCNIEIDAVE